MQLKEIYTILRTCSLADFFLPDNADKKTFIYKDNVQLSIQLKDADKRWGYDYFFDDKRKDIELHDPYDILLKDLCKLKNFPESYNNINVEDWSVMYNGVHIYNLSCVTISNLSSLHASLPLSLDPFDYIANFCDMLNEDHGSPTMHQADNLIQAVSSVKKSSFEEFSINWN